MRTTARRELETVILPFWLERGIDSAHGGFHTCFDNRGRTLVSTDKYTWSQGRFVWLLARAARLADRGLLGADPHALVGHARAGADFLAKHAIRDDGTCHFVTTTDGAPSAGPNGETRSVYADCFVVMGLAELAATTGEGHWLELAEPILARADREISDGTAPTPPYDVPAGFVAFGPRMILLNTLLVHAEALERLGRLRAPDRDRLSAALETVLAHRLTDGTFVEMRPLDAGEDDTLVARHRVPGHALEGLWVALHTTMLLDRHDVVEDLLASVGPLCSSAWDETHGGLVRYADRDGASAPRGRDHGTPYEQLVLRTWDTKLWWVHTEAAYTTALAARRYGSETAAAWFERIWAYTIDTFPGRGDGTEWIQIRDRAGRPLDEVVALPVKDPFHIARNLMQLVELEAEP
ncbi:AGE family epimerase/isomerase [Jiangella gansuensis]|uniref:AGE family epimerase/isomerase n=1 Tax=Jiangella gansuensis TaxID=281473 RepID=UPI0004BC3BA9|nr:AGE family epimerase/isomerase [Jiangella gansuensis]